MIKVNPIGSNQTEIVKGNDTFLFSYQTLVAAFIAGTGWVKTSTKWSKTTSKHINKWIPNNATVSAVLQADLESMFA